jgi:hypothetical protein
VWNVAGQGNEVKVKSFDALSSGKFTARVEFLVPLENPVSFINAMKNPLIKTT